MPRLGLALMAVQLAAMLAFSSYQYGHYAETYDFGMYSQAWAEIAHGHLNPFDTLLGTTFWRNNAEFVFWPLSLLYWVYPHSVDLLWVQDVAVALTDLVAYQWVLQILQRSTLPARSRGPVAVLVALTLTFDPWAWNTIAFDFHPHALAALFVVLAGRDLWLGRNGRCWVWVGAALVCGAPAALYVAGLGAAVALARRESRRTGLAVLAVGAVWFAVITQIGADGVGGADVGSWYAYLIGPHRGRVGVATLALGAVTHPSALAHMVLLRWRIVFDFVAVVGLIGVASPWGLFPAAAVFLPTIFNSDPDFLRPEASFQSWAALPFVLVGTVVLIVWWWEQGGGRRLVAVMAGTAWAVLFAAITAAALPRVPSYWLAVSTPAAVQLSHLEHQVPPDAEVVAVNGLIGRFAGHPAVYELGGDAGRRVIPVQAPVVVFVISSTEGVAEPPSAERMFVNLESRLNARPLVASAGIYGLEWYPPAGTRSFTLS